MPTGRYAVALTYNDAHSIIQHINIKRKENKRKEIKRKCRISRGEKKKRIRA